MEIPPVFRSHVSSTLSAEMWPGRPQGQRGGPRLSLTDPAVNFATGAICSREDFLNISLKGNDNAYPCIQSQLCTVARQSETNKESLQQEIQKQNY